MRRLLPSILILSFLFLPGCAKEEKPELHPAELDRLFSMRIRNEIPIAASNAGIAENGKGVCYVLDAGGDSGEAVEFIKKANDLTVDQARFFVVESVQTYCPRYDITF